MHFIFLILILVYLNTHIDSRDIEILNSGIMQLRKNDMVVVFFVTIHHHGEKSRIVMATMVECCEKITDEDTDCSVIQLFGERLQVVQPGITRNISLLYPNIYGYNRKGSCLVNIWNRGEDGGADDTSEIRHRIDFDTTLRSASETIPPCLQELYSPYEVVRCETTDLDPFDGCNPVDCRMKYSGYRNYFNHKRKRCQKVPKCEGDPEKELPDIVYVPTSNTCRNLENSVRKDDIIELIHNNYAKKTNDLDGESLNIQCHHGEIDVRTGLCVCDKGWKSEPFDPEEYNQGNSVYHMCDKKCHPDSPCRVNKTAVVIGFLLAIFIFFSVIICEHFNVSPAPESSSGEEVTYYQLSGDY